MSSEIPSKYKVVSDEAASTFTTGDSSPTTPGFTTFEDCLDEMRSDTSDSDAEIDMILRTSAAQIKAPEVEKPARRRPWGGVRASCFSDLGDVEIMPRLLSKEAPAKIGEQSSYAHGQDHVAQSYRPCQTRVLSNGHFTSLPMRPAFREHSQKVAVVEVPSRLPSLRSETPKPEIACRDSECSHSFSVSAGKGTMEAVVKYHSQRSDSKGSRAQYSMLQFNATPTLSTSCDPVKGTRSCSARKRATKSGETARPPLDSRTLAKQEATPPETMDSFKQDATPAETLDSFRKMSSSEARAVLNKYMREALSSRATVLNYRRRVRTNLV